VEDADKFEKFLLEKLEVPSSHIISLRDEKATRAAILEGFNTMRDDVKIIKGEDPAMIIYFAGHGARVAKPPAWNDWESNTGQIEMLCPSDINTMIVGEEEKIGRRVDGIPDRTISVLLNLLSDVRGDNVTLILDCCCAGGLNRNVPVNPKDLRYGLVGRQIYDLPPIHPELDREILSHEARTGGISHGFSAKFHGSHILLAACGRDQVAYEDPQGPGGFFTRKLLEILNASDVHDLTYAGLVHRLQMPSWQTPHCEGQHINRRLFNKRAPGADGSFILGTRGADEENGLIHFVLHAGAAQGVTKGSTYDVHCSNLISDLERPNPSRGTVVVSKVDAFSSELSHMPGASAFKVPRLFYCRLGTPAIEKLVLHCDDRAWLDTCFPPDERERLSVDVADDANAAALCLSVREDGIHFDRNDALITPHIGSRLPHVVDLNDSRLIREVIRRFMHFNYHLTRVGGDDFRNVYMELKRLRTEFSADFDQTLSPVGNNLIEKEPAVLVVNELARLGMTIHNRTDLPLYPYLFYFDPSDLDIIEWYAPPLGAGAGKWTTNVNAPLSPKSHLTVGYGDGGVAPWQFLLRDGEDKDVGFFKLFLTTSPADLSSIPQDSPFMASSFSRYGKTATPERPETELWGSQLSTVIQLRDP